MQNHIFYRFPELGKELKVFIYQSRESKMLTISDKNIKNKVNLLNEL